MLVISYVRLLKILILNLFGRGGGKMAPLKVFAEYLKNGLADLHETL